MNSARMTRRVTRQCLLAEVQLAHVPQQALVFAGSTGFPGNVIMEAIDRLADDIGLMEEEIGQVAPPDPETRVHFLASPVAADSREPPPGENRQWESGFSPDASPRWDCSCGRNFLKRVLSMAFM